MTARSSQTRLRFFRAAMRQKPRAVAGVSMPMPASASSVQVISGVTIAQTLPLELEVVSIGCLVGFSSTRMLYHSSSST